MKKVWDRCKAAARAASLLTAIVGLLGAGACEHHVADAGTPSVAYGTDRAESATAQLFTVPQGQMAHVRLVTVEASALPRVLRLTGSVAYNNFETTPVISQVGGPVSRILVSPGENVHPGQVLLEVASPDYAQDRTNYLKARDALSLADKAFARSQLLYQHGAIAQADLEQAESTRDQARADLQSAEQALKVLGVSSPDSLVGGPSSAQVPVLAPIGGEIVERLVSPGQLLQAGATQCFTISNMKTVWVLANVYQQDLGYVHAGEQVEITTDAYPDTFRGRISYIAPSVDATTRTLQVRIVTDNPAERLKKDMYVTAIVRAASIAHAITVPDSAMLRNAENQPFVYVATGTNQFGQRLISAGESQGGRTQILSGLQEGDRVVADGSLFLQFANSFQR
jgi:cobalt-zinc-cadmium efflux system membrane fusion protein